LASAPLLLAVLVLGGACVPDEGPPAEAAEALARARARFAADQPFEAIPEVERAVELAPDWAEAHLALGKLLLTYSDVRFSTATIDRGRLDQAIEHLERACELDPRSADAALWAGRALFKADRFEDAERRLEAALALAPGHAQTLRELGFVQVAAGASTRAVETLSRAREDLPQDGELLLQLGNALEAEERLEEARDAYLAAAAANPAHPGPRSALAVLYGRLGDAEAAERMRQEFERCRAFGKRLTAASQQFEKNSRDPAACMGLAELYREAGMHPEAINWAARALRLDPAHEPARELLRQLEVPASGAETPGALVLDDPQPIAPVGGER
jgi:tetratricopeptide (TPR) repeat protein